MSGATPAILLAGALTANPSIETAPYVGDPPIYFCTIYIDGQNLFGSVFPTNTDAGQVCRKEVPTTVQEGGHRVEAQFSFLSGGQFSQGPLSPEWGFRKYVTPSGDAVWTWESAVVCGQDCVVK